MMTDSRESGFKSYLDDDGLETIKLNDAQQTKLLEGETTVCTANNVLMFSPLSDRKKGTYGILTVTTFKVAFASAGDDAAHPHQHNLLLGPNEFCLQSVAGIYQTGERNKKKLVAGQNVTGKIKELLIICKNMRSFEFSFKDSEREAGKNIANALVHHAYPKRHSLLFAYEYKEQYHRTPRLTKEVTLFRDKSDWMRELRRSRCDNWRVSDVNINFQTSPCLVQSLIVPLSVPDSLLVRAVEHFNNRICPIWTWGTARGAALVRMADLVPTINDRKFENELLEHIRRSHPAHKAPHIVCLNAPSAKELQASFCKLRDLCVPENSRTFRSQDRKFYGLLDGSKWLHYVSGYLAKAVEAADWMVKRNTTVVLQEGNGQDANCIVASLAQIIIDPHCRTRRGFQSLVQKEWVVLGHPFTLRLGLVSGKESEPAPYFLAFLDCVWQLQQQYPYAFEFSETYLTTLWDSCHISIFDTFLFNNEHERIMAESARNSCAKGGTAGVADLVLRNTWDWREQFHEHDLKFFVNPLYVDDFAGALDARSGLSQLEVWNQCYFRWLPELEIRNGGRPIVDIYNRLLVTDILNLQRGQNGNVRARDEYAELLRKVNGFFPFGRNEAAVEASANNIFLTSDGAETQSVFNMNTAE